MSMSGRSFSVRRERRRHKRFEMCKEVFAAFVIPEGPVIVGKVLDASLGGMAVQYLATRKLDTGPASISIFGSDSHRMNRIESIVMYDFETPEESWSNPRMRRCGIRFQERRSELKAQLKEIFRVKRAAQSRSLNG